MASPYLGVPKGEYCAVTRSLLDRHPLSESDIVSSVLEAWNHLWDSRIGWLPMSEFEPPAQVTGLLFEQLLAKVLSARFPDTWRSGHRSNEKDIHCISDESMSIEVKTSGYPGGNTLRGNRSYNQKTDAPKKRKCGYYIVVTYYHQQLTMIRFGWLDADDWKAQKALSGQSATLRDEALKCKLIEIPGPYQLDRHLRTLSGVGHVMEQQLHGLGFQRVSDMLGKPSDEIPISLRPIWKQVQDEFGQYFAQTVT